MRIYTRPPHRTVTGLIPHAGSTAASTFARRRVNEWKRVAKAKTARAVISSIPESRYRFVPPHQQRQKGNITFRGRSGKLYSSGSTKPVGPGWREVSGAAAFPGFGLLPSISAGAQLALGQREDKFGKKRQLVDIKAIKGVLNRLLAIAGLPHVGARFVVWHVGRWCLMEIVAKTPLDTGTAAAGWTISPQIRGKGRGYGNVGFRIGTDVEYVRYLEYGHHDYPPQSMMRSTFQQARSEIRNVMDVLITWWKNQQILLRNLRFDTDLSAGILYSEEDVERRIPNMSWQQLHAMLEDRLPMKDVSELNTSAALAYRIRDPKDWHSAEGFQDAGYVFDAHKVKGTKTITTVDEFNLGSDFEVPGSLVSSTPLGSPGNPQKVIKVSREGTESIEHVGIGGRGLESQVEALRRAWGAR